MKRIIALLIVVTSFTACAELQKLLDTGSGLTTTEVAMGLKEALEVGITNGADVLSARDGYLGSAYKILLPEEARQITNRLQAIPGFNMVEDVIIERINRAAEDAASRARPIFVAAIRSMTFEDAMGILMGPDDAATNYLHRVTYDALYQEFNPVILESLNKFNAIDYWEDAVTAYNRIPFIQQANPRLDDYVTTQALVGLFDMVKKEEHGIRTDVSKRSTDLLRRVFARQDGARS